MIEIHYRSDGQPQPSSRYHDLADLAIFARTTVVDARALTRALSSEADRRGLQLPDKLAIPDPTWGPGYARVARDNPRLADRDIDHALRTAAADLLEVLRRIADAIVGRGRGKPVAVLVAESGPIPPVRCEPMDAQRMKPPGGRAKQAGRRATGAAAAIRCQQVTSDDDPPTDVLLCRAEEIWVAAITRRLLSARARSA